MKKEDLNSSEIEKLKQIISRTDKSGNEKVLLLMDFIYTRENAIHPDLEREVETLQKEVERLTDALKGLVDGIDVFCKTIPSSMTSEAIYLWQKRTEANEVLNK